MPPRSGQDALDVQALLAHATFVRAVARELLRDADRAEDVVQETWLRALRAPPRTAAALRAWLGRVARNLARDMLRRDARRLRRERVAARPERAPREASGASIARLNAVVEAVAGLEEPYRVTVLQRFYDGLGPTRIAAAQGVPVATVKSRLRRALQLMREHLTRRHGGTRGVTALLLPLAGAVPAAGTLPTGGILVMKTKLALVAVILAVAATVTLWMGWRDGTRDREGEGRVGRSAAQVPDEATRRVDLVVAPARDTTGATGETGAAPGRTAPVSTHGVQPKPDDATGGQRYRLAEVTSTPDKATLRIRVVEEQGGLPIEGADVSLVLSIDGVGTSGPRGTTDATGTITLGDLEAEQVLAAGARIEGFYRSYRFPAKAGYVTELVIGIPKGIEARGTVRHVDKGLLAGASITLTSHPAPGGYDQVSAATDSDGRFTMPRVPPGRWKVQLGAAGLAYHEQQQGEWDVQPPSPAEREFVVGRLSLTGIVRDASTGAPIARAEVQAQQPKFASTTTDAKGAFALRSLPPGRYSVLVRRKGYALTWFKDVVVPESGTGQADFAVSPAAELRVTLVDKQGHPLSGEFDLNFGRDDGKGWSGNRITNEPGVILLDTIPVGTCRVSASSWGWKSDTATVEVKPGENRVELVLERVEGRNGATLRGRVREAGTGRPVAGARVRVRAGRVQDAYTDAEGRYEMPALFPGGQWPVTALRDGYAEQRLRTGKLEQGKATTLDFTLTPAQTLHLRVLGVDGRPWHDEIYLYFRSSTDKDVYGTWRLTTDADGRLVCSHVPAGTMKIRIWVPNRFMADAETEILPGDNTLELQLQPG